MQDYYIGVDLGGTKIYTALADGKGEIISRKSYQLKQKKAKKLF